MAVLNLCQSQHAADSENCVILKTIFAQLSHTIYVHMYAVHTNNIFAIDRKINKFSPMRARTKSIYNKMPNGEHTMRRGYANEIRYKNIHLQSSLNRRNEQIETTQESE